jgi:hypothetical protein
MGVADSEDQIWSEWLFYFLKRIIFTVDFYSN